MLELQSDHADNLNVIEVETHCTDEPCLMIICQISRLQESPKYSMATCSTSLNATDDVDSCDSSQDKINDSCKNVSVDSGKEVELVERITQLHNAAVRGDSDAVNQEPNLEVNYPQSKSVKSRPRLTQTVITNSDENLENVLQVYQDDPDSNLGENSQRNKASFLLRERERDS